MSAAQSIELQRVQSVGLSRRCKLSLRHPSGAVFFPAVARLDFGSVERAGTLGATDDWLFKAFTIYGIASVDRQPIADLLFDRLRRLLLSFDQRPLTGDALPHVHVFDSASEVKLVPPDPQVMSTSGDWVNEIHPSPSGYKKLGAALGDFIDDVLSQYPG